MGYKGSLGEYGVCCDLIRANYTSVRHSGFRIRKQQSDSFPETRIPFSPVAKRCVKSRGHDI